MSPLRCADCGLRYDSDGWCDVVLTTDDWLSISPTGHEGGVLCFTCIAGRLVRAGRSDVPMLVTSGPFLVRTEREGLPESASYSGGEGQHG